MSEVIINPQEYYVWLACESGWNRAAGFKAVISEIECSMVLVPTKPVEIIISDLISGSRILSLPVSIIDLFMCDTKEKTLALMEENALLVVKKIKHHGVEYVREHSIKEKQLFENKFGPMPEFEKTSVY